MKPEEIMERGRETLGTARAIHIPGDMQTKEFESTLVKLFVEVCNKDPLIYDYNMNIPLNCFWCRGQVSQDETTVGFNHEEDCLWTRMNKVHNDMYLETR